MQHTKHFEKLSLQWQILQVIPGINIYHVAGYFFIFTF